VVHNEGKSVGKCENERHVKYIAKQNDKEKINAMQEIVSFHQYTLREGIEKDFMSAAVRVESTG
jgi:hypothetical protein